MSQTPHGFRPAQSALAVHQALKTSLVALENAQQCAVLWFGEILDRQLYRELGYTAARVIAPVADKSNEEGWLDFALNNSRRKLEQEVKRAKKEAADVAAAQPPLIPVPHQRPAAVVPVRVNLEMTPTQFARYEALWEQVRKRTKAPADKVEAILVMMAIFVTESSPRGDVSAPPVQLHVHKCSECAQPSVPTSRGELEIGQAELERAECDCRISRPDGPNKASIPPAVRRRVLAHYRHRCQRPGCENTHYLEVHHILPRALGGSHDPDNLTCLCSACHGLVHAQKGFAVRSPLAPYQWRQRRENN